MYFVISVDFGFSSSFFLRISGLFFIQLSFSFPESNAVFTDLSFVTVITPGSTEHSCTFCIFLRCLDFIGLFVSFSKLLCKW